MQDATTKSIVFSQFVNFLDLTAYRLQRAGFNVSDLTLVLLHVDSG
jgi:DNA repair protein RAD16